MKNLRASTDVIGWNNEDDTRRMSSGPDSPYSPSALPSADRFAILVTLHVVLVMLCKSLIT